MKKLHIIAGLPRSGSTLLSGILNQNPRFQSDITDPLLNCVRAVWSASNHDPATKKQVSNEQRVKMMRGVLGGYYQGSSDIVFNTNRSWAAFLPLLTQISPDSKVICLVRNVVNVLNSFETIYQKNPLMLSSIYPIYSTNTVYTRCGELMQDNRPIGQAILAMREGLASQFSKNMLVINYKDFVTNPEVNMLKIYMFLGEEFYQHDFTNVEFSRDEYDASIDAPGLHTVRKTVEFSAVPMLLPRDLQDVYNNYGFGEQE